jgi:hypothetical protein
VGLLRDGRLVDPRLSLTCRDADGKHVAFGWIEPVRGARWLDVGSGRSAERYAVIDALPVRATSRRVSLDSAVFDVTQYGAEGRELERRRIEMHASG